MTALLEQPPAAKVGGTAPPKIEPTITELRAHPGQWMRVGEYATRGSATSFTSRLKRACHSIEAVVRTVDGTVVVYARAVSA